MRPASKKAKPKQWKVWAAMLPNGDIACAGFSLHDVNSYRRNYLKTTLRSATLTLDPPPRKRPT